MSKTIGYALRGAVLMACVAALASCATTRPCASPPGEAKVSQLEYRVVDPNDEESAFRCYGGEYRSAARHSREKLSAEPVYFSKRPMYGYVELGTGDDTKFTFVVDESGGTRSGYDTLYIDANNNEDLTDDVRLLGKLNNEGYYADEFPVAELTVEYDGKSLPYHVKPSIHAWSEVNVSFAAMGYCEGEIDLAGKTYKVAVCDDQVNARFDDLCVSPKEYGRNGTIYTRGDALVVDVDGDGALERKKSYTPETFRLGKYVSLDGRCYEVTVAPNGRSLTLAETQAACGYVRVKAQNGMAELLSEKDGTVQLAGEGKHRVPVGSYRLVAGCVEATDADGKTWQATGSGSWKHAHVDVAAGKSTNLVFGPPLLAKVDYKRSGPEQVAFSLKLTGAHGEEYSYGSFTCDGETLPPPRFEVRDRTGNMVTSGNFEYG